MNDEIPIANGEEIMSMVRDALHNVRIYELSKRVGLSQSTIYAIRRGKTRWPRDYTLFAITYDLGMEIVVKKRKRKK
jgi:transcriptional regulator with XRE-family HTH domain